MNWTRSLNSSSVSTNDACEIPYDASSFNGFTRMGNLSRLGRAVRFEDIRLRLPFHGLQLRAEILVERGAGHCVEQREDFEFSFHRNMLTNPSPGLRPPFPHPMGRGQGEGRFVCFI